MKKWLWLCVLVSVVSLAGGCAPDDEAVAGGQAAGGDNVVSEDDIAAGDDSGADEVQVPEVVRVTDYSERVAGDELVLQNGVRCGMTYDEVAALTGYAEPAPDEEYCSFEADAVWYGFGRDDAGELVLDHMNVTEDAVDASICRDIKIGDSIGSVLAKIPARDTELKKWAWQDLYGSAGDERGYAYLEFVAMSYYSMAILTPEGSVHITFSRDEMCVKWIEMYQVGM